ncbi:TonB-dependent receptor [Pseudomonas brassicacearum]|jgi:iron complex outermembrane receptor protein|uniref:TonB-dependent receptor n=1 Tax=Pseudomonas TaxID=286 RepID=UPI000486B9B7|nr:MULTISPECIES: TonB-dependent receptor [Pseudomonas]URM25809.1 TonB-dependent receptor [Pseudomonas frederiksbergensis]ALQ02934.1 Outer membrane vitamin B12 receptor BtuB [Pseudomonas brassicacearum]MCD9114807.1 TonB-dependent receptor [Pseudomonas bijieensis]UVM46785.1 TonB-dependent receptor [Pseudomonas brassicacearum]UZD97829.1 TonB-dependent receptor [Pseudomonas corrugata]
MFRLTTLALLAGSTCAWAQDTALNLPTSYINASANQPKPATSLDLDTPIESGSRLNLSARENPASVSAADRKTMERIGARNFQDAANALPGVNASAPPGWGGYVSYRGFNGAQISQLFNGINLQYGGAARPVGAWIYDRVELLGGPSSFLNGSGAVGGSLNVITKLANREEDTFEGRMSYGRYDTWETAVGFNKALNSGDGPRHYARLDYSRTSSNGYIDRQENGAGNLAFSLLSDINDRLSHTLAIEYLEEKEDSPYWGTPVLQPLTGKLQIDKHNRFNNYNVEDGRYEQRTRWIRSITDYQLDDNTQLRNTFYHYDGQRDYRNLEVYRYNSDNSAIARSGGYRQRHDQEVNGDRIELTHQAQLFGLASDWALGVDYNTNQQTNYPLSKGAFDTIDPDGFEPGHFLDIPGMDAPRTKGRSTWTDTSSAFVENRTRLTEQLALITALRYDHIDFEVVDHAAQARLDKRWDAITGRLGLVYDLTSNVSLYTQYSTSAEPPGGTLTSASIAQVSDFDLSTGRQFEVGSKFDFLDGRGSATAAAYRIVRKNISVPSSTVPNTTEQAGQQTSTGIELAASFKITPKLLAAGNFSWVRAEYDEFNETIAGVVFSRKGKNPVNIPDRVANLWLTYDVAPDWQLGADVRYVSSVYANTANTTWVPSYTVYGLSMTHDLDKHVQVSARLRNLTDEVYARFIHQSNTQYYVGEPRSLEIAVQWKY